MRGGPPAPTAVVQMAEAAVPARGSASRYKPARESVTQKQKRKAVVKFGAKLPSSNTTVTVSTLVPDSLILGKKCS